MSKPRDRSGFCPQTKQECEIEITPEMLNAGLGCFWDLPELLGPDEEDLRVTLKRAFLRMLEVRREQCSSALRRDVEGHESYR